MKQEMLKIIAFFRRLILDPSGFWEGMNVWTVERLRKVRIYLFIAVLVSAVAVFAHELLKGSQFYALYAVLKSVREIVAFAMFYIISQWCINYFFPLFGAPPDKKTAMQLTLFCMVIPVTVNLLVSIIPFIFPVQILSFYSCYLFWTGLKTLVDFPSPAKRNSYFWVTMAVILVILTLILFVLAKIIAWLY